MTRISNPIRRTAAAVALASVFSGPAYAVRVNPDGTGQVLLFPYYTVRSVGGASQVSLLSLVNTTAEAKAVSVKFLEARNSRMVYGVHVYLSPFDVWTAVIRHSGVDAARLDTSDRSCTAESRPPPPTGTEALPPAGDFVNFTYSGSSVDGAGTGLDRTLEGFVEVIEMGVVTGATLTAISHVSGIPRSCDLTSAGKDTVAGTGGLTGTLEILNVLEGTNYITVPTALEEYSTVPLWSAPGSILPTLAQTNPKVATISYDRAVVTMDFSDGDNPADPVSAVLMHEAAFNQYLSDPASGSATSVVMTFPTKAQYYSGNSVASLFQSNFGPAGACDEISVTAYDREETELTTSVVPAPPAPRSSALCWAANVLTFNGANLFGSATTTNIGLQSGNGWLNARFFDPEDGSHVLRSSDSRVFNTTTGVARSGFARLTGLPFIGFAAINTLGGVLQRPDGYVLTNYGAAVPHGYRTQVEAFIDDDIGLP